MHDDTEVIPSSQPNTTKKKISQPKKRKKGKLALKSTNSTKSSKSQSGRADNGKNLEKPPTAVNIYIGLFDETIRQDAVTPNENMDMFDDVRQFERGNLNDTPPTKIVTVPTVFVSPEGLQTVKSFIKTHQFIPNGEPESDNIGRSVSELSFGRNEAQSVMNESFQFSEWPIEQQIAPLNDDNQNERVSQHLPLEESCISSIVDSILKDFDDDLVQSDEQSTKSPPLILSRKRNPRIYKRSHFSKDKKLMWDNEPNDKESISKTQSNDVDVDLNSSHRIIENIANLSTFFTQSQLFELDFEGALSQNSDELEKNYVIDSNDENVNPNGNYTQIDRIDYDVTSNFWDDDDDDEIFHQIKSPSIDLLNKSAAAKRNFREISTPHSMAASNKRFKMNFATPSTSKEFVEMEQRDFLPKRLLFDAEVDNNQTVQSTEYLTTILKPLGAKPVNQGFSTAAGKEFATSTSSMKKQLKVFAGIEAECRKMVECHRDKSPINKMDNKIECDNLLGSRSLCDANRKVKPTDGFYNNLGATVGFQTCRGGSVAISADKIENSRQLFKKDFKEFSELDATNNAFDNVPQKVIPSVSSKGLYAPQLGFTTATGSNIAITAKSLQKYKNVYHEMDVDIFDDGETGPCAEASVESPIVCKTPVSKVHQNSNRFATSTPNLNGKNHSNFSCITPINKPKQNVTLEERVQESIDFLNGLDTEGYRNILSDVDPKPIDRISTDDEILEVSEINQLDVSILQSDILNVAADIKLAREEAFSRQQADSMKKPYVIPKIGALSVGKLLRCESQIVAIKTIRKFTKIELRQFGLPDNVIELTIENAAQFKFEMWNYYSIEECRSNVDGIDMPDDIALIMDGNCRVGIREIISAFLMCPVVDPKLVPDNWIRNSFKWIVVKLAAMDRAFAYRNDGRYLTPENVMLQLKYRYDREIDRAERPAIRRIVEMDDLAAKRMVLFVSAILNENDTPRALQLCDGWYAIRTTSLDPTLVKAVQNRKIEIGTKLIIQGAELVGCQEGAHPLEMSAAVALKISANSTRRAKWNLKLGFCKEAWPFAITLNSVSKQGGLISRMMAFVVRVYPLVYIVKETVGDSTKSSTRSSKMEKRHRRNEDNKRFEMVEKFYNEANDEVEKEAKARNQTMEMPTQKLKDIDNGEDLWKLMELSRDAESFELNLTMTQKQLLHDYQTLINDENIARINKIASEKLKNWSNVAKSTPMLKVRLIDAKAPTISKMAILNMWNVTEDMIQIRENTFIEVQKAMTKDMSGRDVLITAYGSSTVREVAGSPTEQHANFRRKLTNLNEIDVRTFKPLFNEFDTVGYVFEMSDANPGQFQSIFVIDAHKNVLCIKFWHSVTHYGYDDVVQTGRFLCINHLNWRPQHSTNRNNYPQAFATEYTTFVENPKDKEKTNALQKLRQECENLNWDNYITECRSELDKDVSNTSNNATTPLRPSNVNNNNMTRTPLVCSPSPSQSVQSRISRLRTYGDLAAPSKHIYLGTRPRLRAKLKTPVRNSASAAGKSTLPNENQEN